MQQRWIIWVNIFVMDWLHQRNATNQGKYVCISYGIYIEFNESCLVAQISYYQIHFKTEFIGFILVLLRKTSYTKQVWISNMFHLKDDSIEWNAKTAICILLMLCIRRDTVVIHCMIFWKKSFRLHSVIQWPHIDISKISNDKWYCMTIVMEMCMAECIPCDIWLVLIHHLSVKQAGMQHRK